MSQIQHEDGVCKECIPLNEASVFQYFGKACAQKNTQKYFLKYPALTVSCKRTLHTLGENDRFSNQGK